jgi:flagellar protein FlgJ
MDIPPDLPAPAAPLKPEMSKSDARAWQAAKAFEANFLAEMLKVAGLNSMPATFGGGAGEDAFSSMLTREYADLMASRGGIGLAEQVFESLKSRMQGE